MIGFLIIVNAGLLVLGQILWKAGIIRTGFQLTPDGLLRMLSNLYILSGILIYILATGIWLFILSQKELSMVYPLQSICYVFALLAGWLIFNDAVTFNRWLGTAFIVFGAFLINLR